MPKEIKPDAATPDVEKAREIIAKAEEAKVKEASVKIQAILDEYGLALSVTGFTLVKA